jgi:hypothetical protein
MDDEIERLVVSVRADTSGFARDVQAMRAQLDGPFAEGATRAGRALEGALAQAVRTGKFGFEDLKRVVLQILNDIAASAIRSGIGAILNSIGIGASGGGGGLFGGAPGRATGGPVAPGRAYLVGERGPELFVPTASGRIETGGPLPARDVRVTINVGGPATPETAQALLRSGRQVARAVRRALD